MCRTNEALNSKRHLILDEAEEFLRDVRDFPQLWRIKSFGFLVFLPYNSTSGPAPPGTMDLLLGELVRYQPIFCEWRHRSVRLLHRHIEIEKA